MLYIISTPIGNLKDMSLRGVERLEKVDVLLCEDTRNTGRLLLGLGIKNRPKLFSFYDEVEEQKIPTVVKWLQQNWEVGLVTDAGTPLLSDPGWRLIKKCQELGLEYTAIPGPNAAINALVLAGLPCGRFSFLGFLPKRPIERKKILEKYQGLSGAKVVYESPKRVEKLIKELKDLGYNEIRVVREMTKKFESVETEIKDEKGEVTVVFT